MYRVLEGSDRQQRTCKVCGKPSVTVYLEGTNLMHICFPSFFWCRPSKRAYLLTLSCHSLVFQAFVTQNVDDRDLLVQNLKQFDVPIINQKEHFRQPPRAVNPAVKKLQIILTLETFQPFHWACPVSNSRLFGMKAAVQHVTFAMTLNVNGAVVANKQLISLVGCFTIRALSSG